MSEEENNILDERKHNFFIIDNEIFDYNLTPVQFTVYCVLVRYSSSVNKKSFAGIKTIEEKSNASRNTVLSAIKELEKKCLIRVKRSEGEWLVNEFGQNIYRRPSNVYTILGIKKQVSNIDKGSSITDKGSSITDNTSATNEQYQENCYQENCYQENCYQENCYQENCYQDINIPTTEKQKKEVKHKYGEHKNILLTDQELEKLKDQFDDWQEKIENISEGVAMKGYKYKSHYLAILKWAKNENKKATEKKSSWKEKEDALLGDWG